MRLSFRWFVVAALLLLCIALILISRRLQSTQLVPEPSVIDKVNVMNGSSSKRLDDPSVAPIIAQPPSPRLQTVDELKIPLLRAEYWLATTDGEALWMDERGFPEDMAILDWSRRDIERLAGEGNLRAKNQLMHLRLESGEENWADADARRFGSLYYARLRASFELGLIAPGLAALHQRFGFVTPDNRAIRQVIQGLAFDFLAQRMGDESQLGQMYDHVYGRASRPAFAAVNEIAAAQIYAEEIWNTWNQNRQRNGMPLLESRYGNRRDMMMTRELDPSLRARIQRQVQQQMQQKTVR